MSSKLLISTILFVVLLATANLVTSQKTDVSFDIAKFTSGQHGSNSDDFTLQGDAEVLPNGVVALTDPANPKWTAGRVLYTTPVSIWDSTSGLAASFVTSFSFILEDFKASKPADGIIFFLAPQDTIIPNNSAGGSLGVVDGKNAYNRFVGVEFDNFVNYQVDPNYAHIGIDVNSLISSKTIAWNRVSGSLVKVGIIYDSHSNTLSVAADGNGQLYTISQVVDLKAVLPEKVKIGISGSNAEGRQTQHIISWSFTSTWA